MKLMLRQQNKLFLWWNYVIHIFPKYARSSRCNCSKHAMVTHSERMTDITDSFNLHPFWEDLSVFFMFSLRFGHMHSNAYHNLFVRNFSCNWWIQRKNGCKSEVWLKLTLITSPVVTAFGDLEWCNVMWVTNAWPYLWHSVSRVVSVDSYNFLFTRWFDISLKWRPPNKILLKFRQTAEEKKTITTTISWLNDVSSVLRSGINYLL